MNETDIIITNIIAAVTGAVIGTLISFAMCVLMIRLKAPSTFVNRLISRFKDYAEET